MQENNLQYVAVYGGYINDDLKLMNSASGGIATALTEHIIETGGYVAGVAYSQDFYSATYLITNNKNDVEKLKGSKYIDCEKNNVYAEIKKLTDSGKTVLFFGLPCVVAGLYGFLGNRPEKLITCELICNGPTYTKVHYDYVRYLEKKHKSKVVEFSVRYKTENSNRTHLYAKFKNGKVFLKPFYQTEYGYAFSVLGKTSCYDCKFKKNNTQGDIMIGDFWGATENDPFWNEKGMSCVLAKTEKGNSFLQSISSVKLFKSNIERVFKNNPAIIEPRKIQKDKDKFARLLERKGLFYAVKHNMSYKQRIRKIFSAITPKNIKKFFVKTKTKI